MKKQGYNDRLDERLGMKNGPEKKMKQDYKARRDESRGMERYEKDMGHASKVTKINIEDQMKKSNHPYVK